VTRQFNAAASLKNDTAVMLKRVASTESEGDAGGEIELIILSAAVLPTSE
jgi:hypothetical protein